MKYKWFARFFAVVFTASVVLQPGDTVFAAQAQDVAAAAETQSAETQSAEEAENMELSAEESMEQPDEGSAVQQESGDTEKLLPEDSEFSSDDDGNESVEESMAGDSVPNNMAGNETDLDAAGEEAAIPEGQEMLPGETVEGIKRALADEVLDNSSGAGIHVVHAEDDIASGSYGHVEWVIDASGKLTVSGTGDYTYPATNAVNRSPWFEYREQITSAEINVTGMTDTRYMFLGCSRLSSLNLSNFDTSNVMDMGYMFHQCNSLISLDLSNFNTSNVMNMRGMFDGCYSLTSLDLGNFNTSNVKDMRRMFSDCYSLTSLDLESFNTSSVTDMGFMFNGCSSLSGLGLRNFNTGNVTNMAGMFESCGNLASLDCGNFNTSNVTNMVLMFAGCSSLTSLDLGNFNTSNVTDMGAMFQWCSSLTSLNLGDFNTSNVTSMGFMFSNCNSLINLDLGNFNASNATDMGAMFNECSSLVSINTPYNIRTSASLPTVENTIWRLSDGTEVTEFPQGLDHSVTITRHNTDQAEEKDIPDGAVEFNGHYYYLFDLESVTDADSTISYCNGRNGYLATITSAEENDFLFQYMMSLGYENAYFGFSDRENEGEWKWLNGEEVSYTNWHTGEPNSENPAEDYAMFYFKYEDGTWNDGDFSGGTVRGGRCFICEWGAYEQETIVLLPAVKYVPYDTIIADAENQNYTVVSGSLPSGLSLTADGRLCGVPTENGSFSFTVQVTNGLDGSFRETAYTLFVNENTDANFNTYADPGYELIELVPNLYFESIPDGGSQLMVSVGPFEEFTALYLDGEKLTEGVDYTAESGSTRITIQNQTLKRKGAGSHTLAMEFRTADTGALKWAAQNYIIAEGADPATGGDNENSGNNNTGGDNSENQNNNTTAVVENTSSTVAYTVQFGDTLSKIAQRFYGSSRSWRRIYTDNAAIIRNPNRIYPGQVFIITLDQNNNAAPEAAAKANTSNTALNDSYIVVSGDNLYKIAQKVYGQGVRWNEIYQANKNIIANPGHIYASQVLIIP